MSVKYRKLDANGDYIFGQPNVEFLTDTEAVAQAIKTRLLLLYGEWWETITDGTPFWQSILGTTGNQKNAIDNILQERILGTSGVTTITSFTSTIKNRNYTFTANVLTTYSTTVTVSSSS